MKEGKIEKEARVIKIYQHTLPFCYHFVTIID